MSEQTQPWYVINGAMNQKVKALQFWWFFTGTRAGEGRQTNAGAAPAAAAAAALTHGPHSQPPPTSLCSSEKKALLFAGAGREGGRSLG